MQRWLILLCLIASSILLSFMNLSHATDYAGKYELVSPLQPTTTPDKVEVVELFWYSCPHCKSIENYLKPWLKTKPDYIEFKHMPAIFAMRGKNPTERQQNYYKKQVLFAKAYYTAKVLGVLDKLHRPMFDAVQGEKRSMNSEKAFQKLFAEHGVSKEVFTEKFNNDFTVDSGVRTSESMTGNYGIGGVPVVIVNGKYRLTATTTDGYENMVKVINHLAKEEYKLMDLAK